MLMRNNGSREILDNKINLCIKSADIFQGCVDLRMEIRAVLPWGRGFSLVSMGVEKLWIPSKLIKIWFEKEKLLDKEK